MWVCGYELIVVTVETGLWNSLPKLLCVFKKKKDVTHKGQLLFFCPAVCPTEMEEQLLQLVFRWHYFWQHLDGFPDQSGPVSVRGFQAEVRPMCSPRGTSLGRLFNGQQRYNKKCWSTMKESFLLISLTTKMSGTKQKETFLWNRLSPIGSLHNQSNQIF